MEIIRRGVPLDVHVLEHDAIGALDAHAVALRVEHPQALDDEAVLGGEDALRAGLLTGEVEGGREWTSAAQHDV